MEAGDLPWVEWRLTYLGSKSAWPVSEKVSQRANDQVLFMWMNIYSEIVIQLYCFTLLTGSGRGNRNHSGDQAERQRHGQLQLERGGRCVVIR